MITRAAEALDTVRDPPAVGGILYRQGALEGTPGKRGQTCSISSATLRRARSLILQRPLLKRLG